MTQALPFSIQANPQTEYWRTVHMHLAQLPPGEVFFVISIPNQFSGQHPQVCEVVRKLCGELLAAGKHRLATDAEIATYRAAQEARAQEYAEEELRRKKSQVVMVTHSQAEHIGLVPAAGKKGKD